VVLEEIRKKAEKQNDWKEVQSDGIESKCTKYKSRKYIEEQKCMKWSTVQWRSERLIGKKEKQIRIIRRSQINVFQVS
jgi:hypothetical protein